MSESKKLIILIGPPGSGKGTQAEMLAEKFGFYHLQTSKLGEAKINDPELVVKDPQVAEAKKLYDSGKLWSHQWTANLIVERVEELSQLGASAILDGSPRVIHEAVLELPIFEALYGRENIKIFEINLSPEASFNRNSHRRICKLNQHPIPNFPEFDNITTCPKDGSEIITRTLDDPKIIKIRYEVYKKETEPLFDFFKSKGYNIIKINGNQSILDVHKDILNSM